MFDSIPTPVKIALGILADRAWPDWCSGRRRNCPGYVSAHVAREVMASTCPLCDKPFKTDTEKATHMKKCDYPKDRRKGGNGN